jgi:hypothetical protein
MNYSTFVKSIDNNKNIVNSIKEHYGLNASPALIESYSTLLSTGRFAIDPVVLDLRENSSSISNRYEYTLDDGSVVSITEETQNLLNQILINNTKAITFMNESKENFFSIIQETIKE